jgi:hypothetical protein
MESIRERQKIAEALSRAGLNDQAVAAEVLLLLPEQFLTEYEMLWHQVWRAPGLSGGVRIGDESAEVPRAVRWRVSSGQTETRSTASTKGRGSISKGLGIRDTRAEATKQWADRQLRKVARGIRDRLSDETAPMRRCTGARCRKLSEDTWNYCPFCGSPTEQVDP